MMFEIFNVSLKIEIKIVYTLIAQKKKWFHHFPRASTITVKISMKKKNS